MSAAAATATTAEPVAAPAQGKKKLMAKLAGGLVLVLVFGGIGAAVLMKQRAAAHDEAAVGGNAPTTPVARDVKHPPTFVPLDAFTVNLADKEADRYAQIGITLELAEPGTAEAIKVFMPAIRNNILLVLAHKSAAELLDRDGKARLAQEIRGETARALGLPVAASAPDGAAPVAAVYFSTFIIQ
ncbi:MAG: flagellar basal body-associated FliL family protein [Rubrivivax sp.]